MTVKIKKQILQVRDTALTNMLDFQGVKPVSYTHLDVYKRQIFRLQSFTRLLQVMV